jgi:hypothetical protein
MPNILPYKMYRYSAISGEFDASFTFNQISEFDVGLDNLLYVTSGGNGYGRNLIRMDRTGRVVPFPEGDKIATSGVSADDWYWYFPIELAPNTALGAYFTEAIPTGVTGHSNVHERGFDVSANGSVVGIFEYPDNGIFHVMMWEPSGKLVTSDVVTTGSLHGHGVRMDRDNNLYLVRNNSIPLGQTMLDGVTDLTVNNYRYLGAHGSLVKYNNRAGQYPLDVGAAMAVNVGIQGNVSTIPGAVWIYGGITDAGPSCTCNHTRFDLDGWARSWIPARQLASVVVLDANGNRIARIGRYGNVDDEGIRFAWCRTVALSDRYMYAYDSGNRRILKVKLGYENEVMIELDGTVSLSPGQLSISLKDAVTTTAVTTNATFTLLKAGVPIDTLSNQSGTVKFSALDSGSNYTVNVVAGGYLATSVNNVVIEGSKTTKITVTCTRQALSGIDIRPDTLEMLSNDEKQLDIHGVYADGTTILLDSTVIPTWTSRSTGVADVSSSGLVSSTSQSGSCIVIANISSLGLFDSSLVNVVSAYQIPSYHWKLDETTGSVASDATGSGNNATLQNSPVWGAGRYGNALTFDGVDDYLSTPIQQSNPSVFTLSMWFKTSSITGGLLMGYGNLRSGLSSSYDRNIYMNNAGQIYFGCFSGSAKTVNSTASYNDGAWHHVAVALSGAGMVLYVDGSLAGSDATVTSGENFIGYWRIGSDKLTGWPSVPTSTYFSGQLDDIRVYDNALSAVDIASLMVDSTTVDIESEPVLAVVPENLALNTSPNPFNPNVSISVSGWKTGAELKVLDINGKVVADLTSSLGGGIGHRQVSWNASNRASGVYLFVLRYGKMELKKKAMLVR